MTQPQMCRLNFNISMIFAGLLTVPAVNRCEVLTVYHKNVILCPTKISLVYMRIRLNVWEKLLVHSNRIHFIFTLYNLKGVN
jgi:hypothetical protein